MKKVTVLRFTIELTSPMAIGTGVSEQLNDSPFVTDVNGFPTIPGTSLAGVLRSHWREFYGEEEANQLFGFVGHGELDDGMDSCINISCGYIHDGKGNPISGIIAEDDIDALLRASQIPMTRQHVRINHKGAAAHRGLFDRDMIPKGHRFSFEMRIDWPDEEWDGKRVIPEETPHLLLGLLSSPFLALGSRTRSGLGRFKLQKAWERTFDLTNKMEFKSFCALPVSLSLLESLYLKKIENLSDFSRSSHTHEGIKTLELCLEPRKSWQIGGGFPTKEDVRKITHKVEGKDKVKDKVADFIPWREAEVKWENGDGTFKPVEALKPAVPGSSIKGPLRHRTAFYYNALTGTFADKLGDESSIKGHDAQQNSALQKLFGGGEDDKLVAGLITIEDVQINSSGKHGFQDHVTIDRFTGGAYRGHLFDESFYWGGTWMVKIHVHEPENEIPEELWGAFKMALNDLKNGMLQVGAGDARGHGRFSCKDARWSDRGAWFNRVTEGKA